MKNIEPFRLGIFGPSASGKTTLAKRLLMKQLRGKFDSVYLISPTSFQQVWKDVGIDPKKMYDTPDDKTFEKVIQEIIQKKNENALIICDDCIGTELTKLNSSLSKWILKLRHYNISLMVMSQGSRGLPKIVRSNFSHVAVFAVNNDIELKTLQEEQSGIKDHYEEATQNPYDYLWIDLTKNIKDPARFSVNKY